MSILAKNFCNIVKNGDKAVIQLSTRDNFKGTAPAYEPQETVSLYVRRRNKEYKDRYGNHPIGEIVELTITNSEWAEYNQSDWCPEFSEFVKENYRVKILTLNDEIVIQHY